MMPTSVYRNVMPDSPEEPSGSDELQREVEEKIDELETRLEEVERQLAERARLIREGEQWSDRDSNRRNAPPDRQNPSD
jgi:hypothetical protein